MRKLKLKTLLALCYLLGMSYQIRAQDSNLKSIELVWDSGVNTEIIFHKATDPEKHKLALSALNPFAKLFSEPGNHTSSTGDEYKLTPKESEWVLSFFKDTIKATHYDTMNIHLSRGSVSFSAYASEHFVSVCYKLSFSDDKNTYGVLSQTIVLNEQGEVLHQLPFDKDGPYEVSIADNGSFLLSRCGDFPSESFLPFTPLEFFKITDIKTGSSYRIDFPPNWPCSGQYGILSGNKIGGGRDTSCIEIYDPETRVLYSRKRTGKDAVNLDFNVKAFQEKGILFKDGSMLVYGKDFTQRYIEPLK